MGLFHRAIGNHALRISLIYIGLASSWILFSDRLLSWLLPDLADLSLVQSIKGIGFVLVTATLLYWLIHSRSAHDNQHFSGLNDRRGRKYLPLVLFAALSIGIGATGWLTYSNLKASMQQEVVNSLSGIGKLKAEQIDLWVRHAVRDGELITRNSVFATNVSDWLAQGAKDDTRKTVFSQRLQDLVGSTAYSGAILFDREGNAVLQANISDTETVQHRQDALKAMATASSVLVDFHFLDSSQKTTELGLASPLVVHDKVVGAIYFSIDPTTFLFPLIQRWPVANETAETLLIRQDGDRVVFINAPKFGHHAPLTFSLPLANPAMPSVRAVRGERGGMQGVDYRGAEVQAYADAIPNTNWKILAKQDSYEALKTIRRMGVTTTIVTFFLLVIAGAMLWLWWWREVSRIESEAAMEKQVLAKHYDYLSKYANDIIIMFNVEGIIIEANERACEIYGYSREELIGLSIINLRAVNARAGFDATLDRIRHEESCRYETVHQRRDGTTFPVEISMRQINLEGRGFIHAIIHDITERKLAQERIQRLSQLNSTLSRVNEAIVHLGDREDPADEEQWLYQSVCRIAVEYGGMKMAWIGKLNTFTGLIDPVAHAGDGTEYLQDIVISSQADVPEGRGPTGTALRENRPCFVNNFPQDPTTARWHERAFRYGWGASAAVPIERGNKPYAVLTVYHGDIGAFDDEAAGLLKEVTGDLGFALDMLDIKAQRKAALEKLQFAQLVVESSPVVLWRWQAATNWPTEYVSENVIQFGYSADDFLSGKLSFSGIIHPDDIERVASEVARNSSAGMTHYTQQYRIIRKDGAVRWLDDHTTVIRGEQGEITHYQGTTNDITEQKQAEEAVHISEERFRNIFEAVSDAIFLHDAASGRIIDVNPRVSEMYGYSRDEVLALTVEDLSANESHYSNDDAKQHMQQALSGHVAPFEWRAKHKTGRLFWVEVSIRRTMIAGEDRLLVTVRDIDDRKQAEEHVKKTADLLQLALEGASEAVWEVDVETGEAYVSDEYYRMLDQPPDPPPTSMQKWIARLHPDDRESVLATFRQMVESDVERYQIEFRLGRHDGHYLWILGRAKTVDRNAQGRPKRLVGTFTDITERKLSEIKLQLDAEVFRHSGEGIIVTDADTRILTVNPAFTTISGYSEAEAVGNTPRLLKSDRHDADFYRGLWESLLKDGMWQGEIWNCRKNGEVYPEWLHITPVRNDEGKITNYIGVFSDLTQSKLMQERITQLSRFDPVTGLPNLFFFDDLLSLAISEAEQKRHSIAVIRLDIENFHNIDDTYGFEVGDEALKTVAERLVKNVGKDGIVTRMAKDNFTVAYPGITDVTQATLLANHLHQVTSEPIAIGGHEIHPGVNLGISFYPYDGATPKDLVQRAGIALNHAKADKTSNLRFFEQEMNDVLLSKIALTNDIRRAIEREEFELYYQPQLDLASGKITGLEALVRWNHPVHGFLPPSEFVMLAEESGLILPLGDWILKRAMLQMKEWMDAGVTDLAIAVAVNASAMQMESGDLVDLLQKLLGEIGLPAHSIELELTESLLMSNVGETQKLLQRLKAMGIRLSIDDFGTGYSSLSYLKQFSVDKLKIDKSFIDHVTTDPNDAVIVQATIAMARSMGLTVIAEGVETEAQANYLRTLQCDQIQGYLFSRPLPASAILPLLRQHAGIAHQPVGGNKRTLLLVDDEPNVLASLKRILRREGYQILTASSGEEGLQLLAGNPVGVIISDQRMPAMSGIEFLSRVRVIHPDIIRIVLSGYTEVNTITEAINKGEVYKFLTKPWDDDELCKTIREAFMRFEEKSRTTN